ncbi:MAG: Ig-like domain-containing protein, partial [bacterium]
MKKYKRLLAVVLSMILMLMTVGCGSKNEKQADFSINATMIKMKPGAVYTFNVTGRDVKGIEWYSSDQEVVSVDQNGTINAVSEGMIVITATIKTTEKTCIVKVSDSLSKDVEVINNGETIESTTEESKTLEEPKEETVKEEERSLVLSTYAVTLKPGESQKVKATVKPKATIQWDTTDENVAIVNASGKITAVAAGECQIVVSASDLIAEIDVTVTGDSNLTVSPSSLKVSVGQTKSIKAKAKPVTEITYESDDEDIA